MEVSQPFRLGRSLELNNRFAYVCQGVFRIWTGRKWEINIFPNAAGDCSILWKNSGHYLRNVIPPGVFARHVVDLNRRSLKALPSRQAVMRSAERRVGEEGRSR